MAINDILLDTNIYVAKIDIQFYSDVRDALLKAIED